jgi:hypothetical protein
LAEFTTNNYQSETTSVTPFFVNNSCHLHLNFDIMKQLGPLETPDTQEDATKPWVIHSLVQAEMSYIQAWQQENAD